MRWIIAAAGLLGLSACTLLRSPAPAINLRSPTAVSIAGVPDDRQRIEDMAVAYCGERKLVPRLFGSSVYEVPPIGPTILEYRYECHASPR